MAMQDFGTFVCHPKPHVLHSQESSAGAHATPNPIVRSAAIVPTPPGDLLARRRRAAPMELRPAAKKPLLPKATKDKTLPQDKGWSSFSEGSAGGSLALLISAAIGTGVLALPYGVSCVGIWGSLALFAFAGVFTYYSNTILFDCVLETSHGSYGQLMSDILGKYGGMTLDLFVFVEGLGAVATYVVFIMDYVPQVCELWGEDVWCTDKLNVLAAATLVIWPLSCLKGLSALRYTSTCSIATIVFTCLVVFFKAPSHFAAQEATLQQVLSQARWNRSSFQVLSMACFAFMTHTNSPEIALRFAGGPSAAKQVLRAQTAVLWAVYCGIAVCGYLSFLEDTKQDFLTNYDVQDKLIVMCRCLLSVTLVFACPLNMFPAVQALFNVLEHFRPPHRHHEGLYENDLVRVPVSTLAFAITLGVALKSPHVADLISTISAYFSSPLMFAFPAVMHWKILRRTSNTLPVLLLSITAALWLAELSHFF
ncbi:Amino acid transporter AVT6A (AtAvt6A) [Durusdinium trenchii]|uniref:Amino acid transporter AVT6A (AtAvt6A) n=1 Tax=Durusdinium trenchii TaxID=1381693 RepID=A0ABP0I095_9DINO